MNKKMLLTPLIFTVALAGCASNGQASNKTKGAAIGAIAGAILGKSTSNHSGRRTAIAAVLGGIAGAAVGDYMDKQEEELKDELGDSGITVERLGDDITLKLPDKISFDVNQYVLKPSLTPALTNIAEVLSKYEQTIVYVKGHTDSTGDEQYNYQLSEKRALAVSQYMIDRGLDPKRMIIVGYGETKPIASNDTAQGRAENRRVEIHLEPVVAK